MTTISGLQRSVADLNSAAGISYAPTQAQAQIIGAPVTPTLVVAGAGSGKTETLSLRMVYLLDHAEQWYGSPLSPERILCLTFTTKAAAEIDKRAQERIDKVFGADSDRPPPSVMTYNAYGAQLLSEHGLRVGLDTDLTIATDATLWQLASRVIEQWPELLDTTASLSTLARAVPRLSGQLREHGKTAQDLREWARGVRTHLDNLPRNPTDDQPSPLGVSRAKDFSAVPNVMALADLVDKYDTARRERGIIDYSDQISAAMALASLPPVQAVERSRYAAVLLDEFQDTSPAQLEVFASMFGKDHCVMAVGDPHQAIYGFRGASAAALTGFVEAYGGQDKVQQRSLSVSWRNSTQILQAANAAVAPLREAGGVFVEQLTSAAQEKGEPESELGFAPVLSVMAEDSMAEAATVVAELQRRREALAPPGGAPEDVSAAILCRKKRQFADMITACEEAGVDYEVVGLGGLLDHPDVADLLALLEAAHDPARANSLMRVLTSERVAIGPRDLMALRDWTQTVAYRSGDTDRDTTIIDVLGDLPDETWRSSAGRSLSAAALERINAVAHLLESIRRHTYLSVPELVAWTHRWWGLDIEETLRALQGSSTRPVDTLIDAAQAFVASAEYPTLGGFLAWVDAARAHESGLEMPLAKPAETAVQIMTAHAAKGLEWDVVAVVGLVDGNFPAVKQTQQEWTDRGWMTLDGDLPWELRMDASRLPQWQWHAAQDHPSLDHTRAQFRKEAGLHQVNEERRLFYVALTRAKSGVILSGSWRGSKVTPLTESVFVRELLEAGVVSQCDWAPRPESDERVEPVNLPSATWPPQPTAAQLQRREAAQATLAAMAEAADAYEAPLPWAKEITAMLRDRADRARQRTVVASPTHLSTSAMVTLFSDRDAFVESIRRPMPTAPHRAATHGSAVHAWIERHYGHATLTPEEWFEQARDEDVDAAIDTFKESAWASKTPLAIEVAIDMPIAGVAIRSRIDAVFGPDDTLKRTTVVDWKSGRQPSSKAEQTAREVQLAVYRLAWAKLSGIPVDQVDAAFYYIKDDVTVFPATLMDQAALEEMIRGAYDSSATA